MKPMEMPPLMGLSDTINFILPRITTAIEAATMQIQTETCCYTYHSVANVVIQQPLKKALKGRNLVVLPIGQLNGKLVIGGCKQLSQEDRHNVSYYCGRAVENAGLIEKYKARSDIDHLTGLIHRHVWEERLAEELERCKRTTGFLCVGLMDMDNFKIINDTFGHPIGDLALKQVAQTLKKTLRQYDVPGRYGGDEFVVLFPGTPLASAEIASARLLAALETIQVNNFTIVASLGLAGYPEDGQRLDELVEVADKRMYRNKNLRKNQIGLGGR